MKVSPDGDDAAALAAQGATPFASLQAAIDFADSHRTVATNVCVAAGPACGARATYSPPSGGHFTLRDGISVYGDYESTTWATRCGQTTLQLSANGVEIGPAVQTRTVLDGFRLRRSQLEVTTAVRARGARAVELSNLMLEDFANADVTTAGVDWIGVDVSEDADVTIVNLLSTPNDEDVPGSTGVIYGIRSVGSRVTVRGGNLDLAAHGGQAFGLWLEDSPDSSVEDMSLSLMTTDFDQAYATVTGVHVRGSEAVRLDGVRIDIEDARNYPSSGPHVGLEVTAESSVVAVDTSLELDGQGDGTAVHVLGASLDWSGSVVVRSEATGKGIVLESAPGSSASGTLTVSGELGAVGVQVTGNTPDFELTGSDLRVEGMATSANVFGVVLESCGGSPVIAGNTRILATGRGVLSEGVHSAGNCHPVIRENALIRGESTFNAQAAAVHCTQASGTGSLCRILDNAQLSSESSSPSPGNDAYARSVYCDGGSCAEVTGNMILGGTNERAVCHNACYFEGTGIELASSNVLVSSNTIRMGGCGDLQTGVTVRGSSNTIEGNETLGYACNVSSLVQVLEGYGLYIPRNTSVMGNIVLENSLFGSGRADYCAGVSSSGGASFVANVLGSGGCTNAYVFAGSFTLLQDNDFLSGPNLYTSSQLLSGPALTTLAQVNAMPNAFGNY